MFMAPSGRYYKHRAPLERHGAAPPALLMNLTTQRRHIRGAA